MHYFDNGYWLLLFTNNCYVASKYVNNWCCNLADMKLKRKLRIYNINETSKKPSQNVSSSKVIRLYKRRQSSLGVRKVSWDKKKIERNTILTNDSQNVQIFISIYKLDLFINPYWQLCLPFYACCSVCHVPCVNRTYSQINDVMPILWPSDWC